MSWGLMQMMGQSARERGYAGDLAQLCDPKVGLEWGCRHLVYKLGRANGDVTRGLLLWNGGGDPQYAAKVLARVDKYK